MPNTLQSLLGRNQIPNVPNPEPPGWNNLRAAMMQRFFSQMANPYGLSGRGNAPQIGRMQPYSPWGNTMGGFGGQGGGGGFMNMLMQLLGGRMGQGGMGQGRPNFWGGGGPQGQMDQQGGQMKPNIGGALGAITGAGNPMLNQQQQDTTGRMPVTPPRTTTPPLPGPGGGMYPGLTMLPPQPRGVGFRQPGPTPMGPSARGERQPPSMMPNPIEDKITPGGPSGPPDTEMMHAYDGDPSYAGAKMGFSPIHPPRMPRQSNQFAKSPAMGALMRTLGPVGSAARSGQLAANRTTRRPQVYDGEHYDAIGPVAVGGGGGIYQTGPGGGWGGGQFIPIGSRNPAFASNPPQGHFGPPPQGSPGTVGFRGSLGGLPGSFSPTSLPANNPPPNGRPMGMGPLSQRPTTTTPSSNGMPGLRVPTSRPTHTISAYPGGSPLGGESPGESPTEQSAYDGKKEVSGHLKNHGDMLKKLLPMLLMGGGSSQGMMGGAPSPPISAGRGF